MKRNELLAKSLTLGLAVATAAASMSVPGGLLAPQTVYAETSGAETETTANVFSLPSGQVLDKNVSDLGTFTFTESINDNGKNTTVTVTGTANYQTDWTQFSNKANEQNGYYVPWTMTADANHIYYVQVADGDYSNSQNSAVVKISNQYYVKVTGINEDSLTNVVWLNGGEVKTREVIVDTASGTSQNNEGSVTTVVPSDEAKTYTLDFSKLTLASRITVPSGSLLGKNITEIGSNFQFTETKDEDKIKVSVTGTANYLTEWIAFSSKESEQSGYYVPWSVTGASGEVCYVEVPENYDASNPVTLQNHSNKKFVKIEFKDSDKTLETVTRINGVTEREIVFNGTETTQSEQAQSGESKTEVTYVFDFSGVQRSCEIKKNDRAQKEWDSVTAATNSTNGISSVYKVPTEGDSNNAFVIADSEAAANLQVDWYKGELTADSEDGALKVSDISKIDTAGKYSYKAYYNNDTKAETESLSTESKPNYIADALWGTVTVGKDLSSAKLYNTADSGDTEISSSISAEYTGEAVTGLFSKVKIDNTEVTDSHYTVTYQKQNDGTYTDLDSAPSAVGSYKLVISPSDEAKGSYFNSLEKEFTITGTPISADNVGDYLDLSGLADLSLTYNGENQFDAIKNAVKATSEKEDSIKDLSVKVKKNSAQTAGEDATGAGEYTVVVSFTDSGATATDLELTTKVSIKKAALPVTAGACAAKYESSGTFEYDLGTALKSYMKADGTLSLDSSNVVQKNEAAAKYIESVTLSDDKLTFTWKSDETAPADSETLVVTVKPDASCFENYETGEIAITINVVTGAVVSVAIDQSALTYHCAAQELTYTITDDTADTSFEKIEGVTAGAITGLTVAITTKSGAPVDSIVNAGTYTVTATYSATIDQKTYAGTNTATVTVSKAQASDLKLDVAANADGSLSKANLTLADGSNALDVSSKVTKAYYTSDGTTLVGDGTAAPTANGTYVVRVTYTDTENIAGEGTLTADADFTIKKNTGTTGGSTGNDSYYTGGGSSGSAGGGGSSSGSSSTDSSSGSNTTTNTDGSTTKTETTTNKDGSTTKTETTTKTDGSTTKTETTTKTDGSTETKTEVKNTDGSTETKTETVKTDGSKETKTETVKANGTTENKTEVKNTDGSTESKTEIVKANGTTQTKTEVKNTDGSSESKTETVKANGTTQTKTEIVNADGSSESKTETVKANGTTQTKTEVVNADGSSESKTEIVRADGSAQTKTEVVNADNSSETKTETVNADGTSEVKTVLQDGEGTKIVVNTEKDENGKTTDSSASVKQVSDDKGAVISADTIEQVKDAAGTKNVAITTKVVDSDGNTTCKVTFNAGDVKAGKNLKVYKVDSKTGELVMVNNTTYKVDKDGNVSFDNLGKGNYQVMTASDANKYNKQVLKTVKPENSKQTVEQGEQTTFKMDDGLNMKNVKKITYKTSKKSVATVDQDGNITTKKSGKVTVKATVTLNNGKKKTVKMTITVKGSN